MWIYNIEHLLPLLLPHIVVHSFTLRKIRPNSNGSREIGTNLLLDLIEN
jgi:hypothetical protein